MRSSDINKGKPYERPIFRELTREQAVVFLVGHAYIGNQGAKELMELLFPLPTDARIERTHDARKIMEGPKSKGEQPVDHQEGEYETRRENRRQPRFQWESEVTIRSKDGFFLPGRTLDISESGISALLPVELQVGQTAELKIKLPGLVATSCAVVRNRSVFRHGFEFLQPLHDAVGHDAADDDCRSCGGTGFIVQAVDGGQGVAFIRSNCPDCGGTGKRPA